MFLIWKREITRLHFLEDVTTCNLNDKFILNIHMLRNIICTSFYFLFHGFMVYYFFYGLLGPMYSVLFHLFIYVHMHTLYVYV